MSRIRAIPMAESCHSSAGRKLSYVRAAEGRACNSRRYLENIDERVELDIGQDRDLAALAGPASGRPGGSRSDVQDVGKRLGKLCPGPSKAFPNSQLFRRKRCGKPRPPDRGLDAGRPISSLEEKPRRAVPRPL